MADRPPTILCLASYEKGAPFLRESKRLGCRVLLLTVTSLEQAAWPRESIDEIYHMQSLDDEAAVINGVSYLLRAQPIDRIVPLDEYDVALAAALREHLRIPGLSATETRYLRDKLAMRMGAATRGIPVPEFTPAFNDEAVRAYIDRVPPPWLVKPRAEASTIGIARADSADELWALLSALGDRRSFQLIERYVPGDVYHVDSIIVAGSVPFAVVSRYGRPPLDVFHHGGSALTRMLPEGSPDDTALQELNRRVIAALGPPNGITHMEFIKGEDGQFRFLEVAARVGGAYISDAIELATGINLWTEWARIECAGAAGSYALPKRRHEYAGVIIALARQESPDTSAYRDPEIAVRLEKQHHVGFIVRSPDAERVDALLEDYAARFAADFLASLPPFTERPPSHT